MNRLPPLDDDLERLVRETELFRRGDELLDRARAFKQRLLNRVRHSKRLYSTKNVSNRTTQSN